MRRLFLILAFLGALVAGWTPLMASSMHAAASPAGHAGHAVTLQDDHTGHEKHKQDNQKHGRVHPLLCSACFAVVAEGLSVSPSRSPFALPLPSVATMTGGIVRPLAPPPRA